MSTTCEAFEFNRIRPERWQGRYRRPKGDESAYHVDANGVITLRWRDIEQGYKFDCRVPGTPASQELAMAVNNLKRQKASWPGGTFTINEFGQVICPVQNSRERFIVGRAKGPLYFEDPWEDGKLISLFECDCLDCGDEWKRPYLGIQYQLHAGDHFYFWNEAAEGSQKTYPKRQDKELIEKIRELRPNGAVRIIVNQHGIVLTKKPVARNLWKPVFVGKINYGLWFEMEG